MIRPTVLVLCAVLLALPITHADAHPLHTTLTELTEDRARGTVRATIRVFADDFGTAVARFARGRALTPGPVWDAAAFGYVSTAFGFIDRAGRPMTLRSCGLRRSADLLWLCVETDSAEGLALLKVRAGLLCELFGDQVNVVQGMVGGSRRSLLFTRGDKPKAL